MAKYEGTVVLSLDPAVRILFMFDIVLTFVRLISYWRDSVRIILKWGKDYEICWQ